MAIRAKVGGGNTNYYFYEPNYGFARFEHKEGEEPPLNRLQNFLSTFFCYGEEGGDYLLGQSQLFIYA